MYYELAKKIINAKGKIRVSLDLGITTKVWDAEQLRELLGLNNLKKVKGRVIHVICDKKMFKLSLFSDAYYALVFENGFPILEINGIRMHVLSLKNPFLYAKKVARYLNTTSSSLTLETCFGQGYITRYLKGNVVCFEKSREVLELAQWNPYSKHLFENPNIKIINADVTKEDLRGPFTHIVHDPPTIKIAEDLYSLTFYKKLYSVALRGAVLHHYVGNPKVKRGYDVYSSVSRRLKKAGWNIIKIDKTIESIFAKKP